jgi:hypothetical protein
MAKSTLPKEQWGVHEGHCCPEHGCKYHDEDCPVALKDTESIYPCEICSDEKIEGKMLLAEYVKDNIWFVGYVGNPQDSQRCVMLENNLFVIRTLKELKELFNLIPNS